MDETHKQSSESPETSVDAAFQSFLDTRRDHREGLTARQQLWLAFKAGADYATSALLNEARK